jgi:hypothetical protein
MKRRVNRSASAGTDTTDARAVVWLRQPVKLLPNLGPVVVGAAPPAGKAMLRHWRRVGEHRGASHRERQA